MFNCGCNPCQKRAEKKDVVVGGRRFRRCDGCEKPIPVYADMGGHGFESHTVDHKFVDESTPGKPIVHAVRTELCYDCYKADFRKAYPGQEPPVIANARTALLPQEDG